MSNVVENALSDPSSQVPPADFEDDSSDERSSGRLAQQSVNRGPLGDWWREGAARVHVIGK